MSMCVQGSWKKMTPMSVHSDCEDRLTSVCMVTVTRVYVVTMGWAKVHVCIVATGTGCSYAYVVIWGQGDVHLCAVTMGTG